MYIKVALFISVICHNDTSNSNKLWRLYTSLYREENIEKIENEARKEHMTIIRRINRK